MHFDSQIDPARVILGFAVCLFLALVCLMKWQRRRHFSKVRVKRGLRVYVTAQNHNEQAA